MGVRRSPIRGYGVNVNRARLPRRNASWLVDARQRCAVINLARTATRSVPSFFPHLKPSTRSRTLPPLSASLEHAASRRRNLVLLLIQLRGEAAILTIGQHHHRAPSSEGLGHHLPLPAAPLPPLPLTAHSLTPHSWMHRHFPTVSSARDAEDLHAALLCGRGSIHARCHAAYRVCRRAREVEVHCRGAVGRAREVLSRQCHSCPRSQLVNVKTWLAVLVYGIIAQAFLALTDGVGPHTGER